MIIHWYDSDGHYLCNKACGVIPKKKTRIPERVTCKNCLKILKDEIKPREENIETLEESNDRFLYRKQIASDYSPKGDRGSYW